MSKERHEAAALSHADSHFTENQPAVQLQKQCSESMKDAAGKNWDRPQPKGICRLGI